MSNWGKDVGDRGSMKRFHTAFYFLAVPAGELPESPSELRVGMTACPRIAGGVDRQGGAPCNAIYPKT